MSDASPQCTGKLSYPSPQAAWDAIEKRTSVKPNRYWRKYQKPVPEEPYRCDVCGAYHCATACKEGLE